MIKNIKSKYFINKGIYDNKDVFENTLESIKEVIKVKKGIYLTIRETKDYNLVIYEDSNLSRLQNIKDKVSDMTYEDLSYLSFYHIPTLQEVLTLINGKIDIIFDIKIKSNDRYVYELLNKYEGNFIVVGNAKIINRINKDYPNITVGEIITKKRQFSLYNLFIKPDFISYDLDYFDTIKYKKLKEGNKPIIGYKADNTQKYNDYKDIFEYLVLDNYKNISLK